MNIRKLIQEAITKNISFEHEVIDVRNTEHKSSFHLGAKPINAKEMGLEEKKLPFQPLNTVGFDREERLRMANRTEREKDYDAFMLNKKYGAGGPLNRGVVENAPRLDMIMCGAVLKEVKVNRIFSDVNGNFVVHVEKVDDANFWGKPWSESRATPTQLKLDEALKKVNDTFGTLYFIDVSYPKVNEEIFVVKCGKKEVESNRPVTYGQFLDFSKIMEEQKRILRMMEAMNGLGPTDGDNTPWKCITEFGKNKG